MSCSAQGLTTETSHGTIVLQRSPSPDLLEQPDSPSAHGLRPSSLRSLFSALSAAILGLLVASGLATPLLQAQTCPWTTTIRQEVCPGGSCASKGATLTYQELDRDLLNTVGLCSGPGLFTWPTVAAGVMQSTSGGALSILAPTDDNLLVGSGTAFQLKALPNCTDTTGNHLNYTTSTNTFSCGTTSSGGGGGFAFSTIDAGTGTDPVADAAADTLIITSGDGIVVLGDATADSVTISQQDPMLVSDMQDEFCSRNTTAGVYGSLNWSIYGTNALSEIAAEASHPCIQTMFTTTTSGNVNAIGMGKFSNTDQFRLADIDRAWFVIKTDVSIASTEIRVGFMDDLSSTNGGNEAFLVEYDPTVSGVWRCITRTGGVATTTASAVTVAANTWYTIELERTSGAAYRCYVNSLTSFASHTTNISSSFMQVGFAVETQAAAGKTILIDFFRLLHKVFTQRW